jgi:DHA3 family multidrug efflux protein-like MFS transporter
MKTFYALLGNTLIVVAKNNFVWFAVTFWLILQTRSVVAVSILGGLYMLVSSFSSFWLGSLVDHYRKKQVLLGSNLATLTLFAVALAIYSLAPAEAFLSINSVILWTFIMVMLAGVIAGGLYQIAIPTLVTQLVAEDERDKANGLFGTVTGIAFSITSIASGLTLAYAGMWWVLMSALFFTVIALIYLLLVPVHEKRVVHHEKASSASKIDIKGTIKAIQAIPGLFALIFFTTFNNFLGGVFMALMDTYGLSLVSVQVWGFLWGFLGLGFILGGLLIAKWGLGEQPLRTLFRINMVTWSVCIFFTIQPSIILLIMGIFVWITLMPFIEATEQTIIQKVVPPERQGRVFGFAHSIEQAASPLTAFLIGPIAQYIFIPFMTTGAGVELIGDWFGVGQGRGIALVFIMTGLIGLMVTLIAQHSRSYKLLAKRFAA